MVDPSPPEFVSLASAAHDVVPIFLVGEASASSEKMRAIPPLLAGSTLLLSGCWLLNGLDDKEFTRAPTGSGGAITGSGGSGALGNGGAGGSVSACGEGAPEVMPIISRNVPAYGTEGGYPLSNANDQDYGSYWRAPVFAGSPAWVAYDLSGVPEASRQNVIVVWYNGSGDYDHALQGTQGYNNPGAYTIQISSKPGGIAPENDADWTTVVTVSDNTLRSRQHVVDLGGQNWLRFHATESDGSPQNDDIAIQVDVFSAQPLACDDWILFGNEHLGAALDVIPLDDANLAEFVEAALPGRFPLIEYAGMSGWTADDLRKQFAKPDSWLAQFPGRYVGLAFGTKEAELATAPESFRAHLADVSSRVLAAGKIPVVANIPALADGSLTSAIVALNAEIETFHSQVPEAVRGADLWAAFEGTDGFDKEDAADRRVYRDAWLEAMLKNVYEQ